MSKAPVAIIILDGFGWRKEEYGNAVVQANKPNFDRLWNEYPHNTMLASGLAVGLPEGQWGILKLATPISVLDALFIKALHELIKQSKTKNLPTNDKLNNAI